MNTTRVYDVPTPLMLIAVFAAVIAVGMAVYAPKWALVPSDITGAWAVVALAVPAATYFVYKWIYGSKVKKSEH
jgi:hypothetical protein